MAKVYIVNAAAHDFSGAMKFTNEPLIVVTAGHVPMTQATYYAMAQKLADFTEEDFLLLSGSATLTAFAIAFLKDSLDIESINVLVYQPWANDYRPSRINGYIAEFARDGE